MDKFLSTPSARRATASLGWAHLATVISIHALREEGDSEPLRDYLPALLFLSTPSARRATGILGVLNPHKYISIHALREEGDPAVWLDKARRLDFYPRPPRGGRLCCASLPGICLAFLSTPSARRATCQPGRCTSPAGISIHALREEGDYPAVCLGRQGGLFLSTPSARRATLSFG